MLSYALLAWILPAFIGGLSVLNRLKPSDKPIAQISDSTAIAPPVLNIPFESTNSGTINIKGYASAQNTVEIYLDDELKTRIISNDDGSFSSDDINLNFGTNNLYGKTVDDKGNKSLPSKTIRLYYDNEKPKLEIKEPEDNKTITGGDKKVTVSGTVDSQKSIKVSINDIKVIVNSNGDFSKVIDLNDGDNNITINATDTAGNNTQITRKVIYQP